MSDFSDLSIAQQIDAYVKQAVQKELQKHRPAPRYATVRTINTDDKSCMVTFIGETDHVRVVYNNIVPAEIGQHVRIEGTAGDRYISAIRGSTEADYKITAVEGTAADANAAAGAATTAAADATTAAGEASTAAGLANTAAGAAQADVNVARANLAGTSTTDPNVTVTNENIYDNAGFIGYSKCFFIANTVANWGLPGAGTFEMAALSITSYNGVQVNHVASDGRYTVTILEEGYYEFNVSAEFGIDGGEVRVVYVRVDGVAVLTGSANSVTDRTSAHISGHSIFLTAGQVISFYVFSDDPDQEMIATGTHVTMKQISSLSPSFAVGTLNSDFTLSFSGRQTIGPLRNNSGGTWALSRVKSPSAIAFGSVLCKVKYSGGSGNIYFMRNGAQVGRVFQIIPFSGTFTFIWSGPVTTTDEFWIEADASGTYKANETFIKISGA